MSCYSVLKLEPHTSSHSFSCHAVTLFYAIQCVLFSWDFSGYLEQKDQPQGVQVEVSLMGARQAELASTHSLPSRYKTQTPMTMTEMSRVPSSHPPGAKFLPRVHYPRDSCLVILFPGEHRHGTSPDPFW